MKSFIVAILIGAVMITGCIFYMLRLEEISKTLVEMNEKMIDMVEKEDYKSAKKIYKRVSDYVEDKHIMLAATENHDELDQIEIYLSQVEEYIEEEHKGDALAHCESLAILFKHLPKDYRLKLENIL